MYVRDTMEMDKILSSELVQWNKNMQVLQDKKCKKYGISLFNI